MEGELTPNIQELVEGKVLSAKILPLYSCHECLFGRYEFLEKNGMTGLSLTDMGLLVNFVAEQNQLVKDINRYLYRDAVLYYICRRSSWGLYFEVPISPGCDCSLNISLTRRISVNKKLKDPIKTALRLGNCWGELVHETVRKLDIGKSSSMSDMITLFRVFDRSKLENLILGIGKYYPDRS